MYLETQFIPVVSNLNKTGIFDIAIYDKAEHWVFVSCKSLNQNVPRCCLFFRRHMNIWEVHSCPFYTDNIRVD